MKKILRPILTLLFIAAITACGEDRSGEYYALTAPNEWIYNVMKNDYLWYEDLPAEEKLNFLALPKEFFPKLLSTKSQKGKGDKYSYIKVEESTKSIATDDTYGFEFQVYTSKLNAKNRYARVLYTLPHSPAAEAGLQRGDWIAAINGAQLTNDNYERLLSGNDISLTLANLQLLNDTWVWENDRQISLKASRPVTDNPIYDHRVIDWEGVKVGYLMYNHFTPGPNDASTVYDEELASVFREFGTQGVKDLILDLRYNQGGLLSSAQLLATLIVPSAEYGEPFCHLKYNDKRSAEDFTLYFDHKLVGEANVGIENLYVITGAATASSSEAVIQGLLPYSSIKVTLIGAKTVGKNVASVTYKNDQYPTFELHPIIAELYNAKEETNYSGIEPEFKLDETTHPGLLLPFGDTGEYMLSNALHVVINNTLIPVESEKEESSATTEFGFSSLSTKKQQGIQLD